jgi:uncharacterized membrane protein
MRNLFRLECQKRFLSGLLMVLPLFITILVLRFLFNIIMGLFSPAMNYLFPETPAWAKFALSSVTLIAVLYLLGALTGHFIGRWFWNRLETLLLNIPLLRSIYGASRDVVRVFCSQGKTGFKEVVLLEFPRPGMKAVGFVTGVIMDETGQECFKVFVPTTPNPTSGFLEIVDKSMVVRTTLSVEDGIKLIMSGGILGPEAITRRGDEEQASFEAVQERGEWL